MGGSSNVASLLPVAPPEDHRLAVSIPVKVYPTFLPNGKARWGTSDNEPGGSPGKHCTALITWHGMLPRVHVGVKSVENCQPPELGSGVEHVMNGPPTLNGEYSMKIRPIRDRF